MKKVNFNSLDNIEIPDSWADKAVLILQHAPKKSPLMFFRFSRALVAVTSLVLVCAVGLIVYFFTQSDSVTPMASQNNINMTDSLQETTCTDTNQSVTNSEVSKSTSEYNVDETIADNTSEPSEKSTESVTKPTQKPTQKPTSLPVTKPTDIIPTDSPSEPPLSPNPSEAPSKAPSEDVDEFNIYVMAQFRKDLVLDDGKIYCRVYDSKGYLLGNKNLYVNSHLTELSFIPYGCAKYYPYRYNLITKSDRYTFIFYNRAGETVYTTTSYLQPK